MRQRGVTTLAVSEPDPVIPIGVDVKLEPSTGGSDAFTPTQAVREPG